MKKFLSVLTISAFLLTAPMAMAGSNCDGPHCIGIGAFDANTFDAAGGIDADLKTGKNAIAGGIGAGGALAGSQAAGVIFRGEVEAELETTAGGGSDTDTYKQHLNGVDRGVKLGSRTDSFAVVGGSAKVKVDPDKWGAGTVGATMFGIGGQASLNGSAIAPNENKGMETEGFSGGIAGQGSVGGFVGAVDAASLGDYSKWEKVYYCDKRGKQRYYYKRVNVDSKAGAGMGAEIIMGGYSQSESGRYVDGNTEGLFTNVAAGTSVESHGYDYDWDKGLSNSNSYVAGGFIVAGGAATKTVQAGPNGIATASAKGAYLGAGELGCDFNGSVNGYSATSITTVPGMKGSISTSQAGMQVTASNSSGQSQDQR